MRRIAIRQVLSERLAGYTRGLCLLSRPRSVKRRNGIRPVESQQRSVVTLHPVSWRSQPDAINSATLPGHSYRLRRLINSPAERTESFVVEPIWNLLKDVMSTVEHCPSSSHSDTFSPPEMIVWGDRTSHLDIGYTQTAHLSI